MSAFATGDRVLWHHEEATKHAPSSVLRASVVESLGLSAHPDRCHATVGTIIEPANAEETWWKVDFDGEDRVLTLDELVRVEEDS